jgi:hypothetical protein
MLRAYGTTNMDERRHNPEAKQNSRRSGMGCLPHMTNLGMLRNQANYAPLQPPNVCAIAGENLPLGASIQCLLPDSGGIGRGKKRKKFIEGATAGARRGAVQGRKAL